MEHPESSPQSSVERGDSHHDVAGNDDVQCKRSSKADATSPRRRRVSLAALLAILALVSLSSRIMSLPMNRIIELRYCQTYSRVSHPDESQCKGDEVQRRLGWLQGAFETAAAGIDIGAILPFGYVADRIGTRIAVLLNVSAVLGLLSWTLAVGYLDNIFPIEAILAGPFLTLWGGGESVMKSISLTMLADIAQDEAQRTRFLAYMTSVSYISMFFSPALAAALMETNLWLPLWVGIACMLVTIPLVFSLPRGESKKLDRRSEMTPLLEERRQFAARDKDRRNPLLEPLRKYADLVGTNKTFRLLLIVFYTTAFASSNSPLLIRYISKRYMWSYSNIGYLFTLKATLNVALLALGVPAFTRLMTTSRRVLSSATQTDLVGARLSILASIVGAVLIASSVNIPMLIPSMGIYAVGSVLPVFMYSLVRSDSVGAFTTENESSAFAVVVLASCLGTVTGTPFMTFLWVDGIGIGGAGLGLPYFASAITYAIAMALMLRFRIP